MIVAVMNSDILALSVFTYDSWHAAGATAPPEAAPAVPAGARSLTHGGGRL